MAWTEPDSDDAWLALDRNGNGTIDDATELFGNYTEQSPPPAGTARNGFLALVEYDRPARGGNGDNVIDSNDAIFSSLRLWQDKNHNGTSEDSEIQSLAAHGITAISLLYYDSARRDEYGNVFRYRAKVYHAHRDGAGRWAWDVVPKIP